MFACSRVETENLFYNPKNSYNKKRETTTTSSSSSPSSNKSNKITFNLPSYNNNSNSNSKSNNKKNHFMITENDLQQKMKFEKYHEASLKRNQLQQELQRRHQVCAEKERLCRERAEKQMALKKVEECNALRKFYELKSAQLKNNNGCLRPSSSHSSLSSKSTSTFSSSSTSFSSLSKNSKSLPSRSMSSSIKKFQAAYKIYSFIKHHIEKKNTLRIISYLSKLRSIQNQLLLLKSINLKGDLTFKSTKEVLPISANNKAFLIYKESLLKIKNKLYNDFSDEYYLVRERKFSIINTVNIMLRELDNFIDLQYKNFIKNIEKHQHRDDDFVIINRK